MVAVVVAVRWTQFESRVHHCGNAQLLVVVDVAKLVLDKFGKDAMQHVEAAHRVVQQLLQPARRPLAISRKSSGTTLPIWVRSLPGIAVALAPLVVGSRPLLGAEVLHTLDRRQNQRHRVSFFHQTLRHYTLHKQTNNLKQTAYRQ